MEKITTRQQAEEWIDLNIHKLTGKQLLIAKARAKLLPDRNQTEEERQEDILKTYDGKVPMDINRH